MCCACGAAAAGRGSQSAAVVQERTRPLMPLTRELRQLARSGVACGLSTMSCSTTCCTLPTAARPRRPSRAVPSRRPCRCDRRDRVTSPCRVYVQHCVCVCVCVCVSAALSRQADTSRQWPRVVSGAEELCYRVFCKDCGAPSALRCMWQRAVTPTPCGHAPGPLRRMRGGRRIF